MPTFPILHYSILTTNSSDTEKTSKPTSKPQPATASKSSSPPSSPSPPSPPPPATAPSPNSHPQPPNSPRSKPLPKPKPPTKWEQFARAKGIGNNKGRRDRKEWDEEKQEWVNRWGWKGKNKELETQWAVEVPANARAFRLFSRTLYIRRGPYSHRMMLMVRCMLCYAAADFDPSKRRTRRP